MIPILFGSRIYGTVFLCLWIACFFYIIFLILRKFKRNKEPSTNLIENTHVAHSTNIGKRSSQQDRVLSLIKQDSDSYHSLIAVCDGMGGMDSGDYASAYCIAQLELTFGMMAHKFNNIELIKDEIRSYDYVLSNVKDENNRLLKCGTTLVAAYIENGLLNYISVGDSRLYLLQGSEFKRMTTDHNYYMELLEMVDRGEISHNEANNDPQKESLINYIGKGSIDFFETNQKEISLSQGDIVIVCSDGLTKSMNDYDIFQLVNDHRDETPQYISDLLIKTVLEKDYESQDNVSIALFKA